MLLLKDKIKLFTIGVLAVLAEKVVALKGYDFLHSSSCFWILQKQRNRVTDPLFLFLR